MTLDNYFNLGIDHYERGELDDALICFKKCIELDPKDSLSYNNVGLMYYSLHKFNESIFYFNNAIEIEPDSFDAYFNRGLANIQLNLNTDAFNDFKFLSINCPDYPGLSEQLEEIQNIESFHSMTYSSSRLLIDYGKNPDGAFKMGQIAEKNNDYLSAIKDYTVAINNKEGFAEALIARGRCYEKIKNRKYLIKYFSFKKTVIFVQLNILF